MRFIRIYISTSMANSNLCFHQLSLGAQLILWATRHWMHASRQGRQISSCVWPSFAQAQVPAALLLLCDMLRILSFLQCSPIQFAAVNARGLTVVERELLQMLVALDRGEPEIASRRLCRGMSEESSAAVIVRAVGLLRCLGQRNIRVTAPIAAQLERRENTATSAVACH